ncbi:hypothetical protein AXF42_Ash001048 [Apostasia shenzhenica]|uniref:Uncharacterized protein n=1 Tax=Apostasia shenzhenica TaxID=1088818 RepID=A0A2I0ATS8_9ASPA|nr:hypothetical protein AXF42_Ash001048 [Apostasia shenzhenica]
MTRSSRHKSHRSHKHSSRDARERSDSEDDVNSRDRRHRAEEAAPGSGARVSRDVETEKRKSSSSLLATQEKDKSGAENGDLAEYGKKRKDRGEGSVTPDRWNGGGKDDPLAERGSSDMGLGIVDSAKVEKSRHLTGESKSRSSRRREASIERHGESRSRTESVKRRSEKEYVGRDYRSEKERDRERVSERGKDRERVSERNKKVQDSRHGRSDEIDIRIQDSRRGGAEEERTTKKDSTECQVQDELHNTELEKELDKGMKKRKNATGGIDKWQDDAGNIDEKRLSSRDDHSKSASYKVEGHKEDRHRDDRYRDKYYKDHDRDQRHRESRHRDERSSRDYANDRSESRLIRDRDKPIESYSKKSKLHGSDREGSPFTDDHGSKSRDAGARKRSYDENPDHYDGKHRSTKEPRHDEEKDASNSSKTDYHHHGWSSPSPKTYSSKDQSRYQPSVYSFSMMEYAHRELVSDDRARNAEAHDRISAVHERISEPLSLDKFKRRDQIHSGDLVHESVSLYDRTPKSDGYEKSPPASDRRFAGRSGSRRSVDIEDALQKTSTSKNLKEFLTTDDRERPLPIENSSTDSHFQAEMKNNEHASVGQSPFKRTGHFPGSSPGHLLPQPPVRHGVDSPSYDDDSRIKSGDRRSSSRYRRGNDSNTERGQGMAWKNGPTWNSTVQNGFIPFQHGPPAPGFPSSIPHFPPPSLFGARPYVEMNQSGIPYHMHDVADRFPGHGHPFGWHHPVDDSCPPQLQGWDGNSLFGDKSQLYGRPNWDPNRHLTGGRGWELNAELWKGQNANMSPEISAPQKELAEESRGANACLESHSDVDHLEHVPDDATPMKRYNDPQNPRDNNSLEVSLGKKFEKTSLPLKKAKDDNRILCNYLAKIEISDELVHPDLYKQLSGLLSTVGGSAGIDNTPNDADSKIKKDQISAMISNLSSLRPCSASPDTAFQRAIALYKKYSFGGELKASVFSAVSEDEKSSTEIKALGISVPSDPVPVNTNSPKDDLEMEGGSVVVSNLMEGEDGQLNPPNNVKNLAVNMELEHAEVPAVGCDSKQQYDLISDVYQEIPPVFEDVMPDCRVNLSRIHNPPESTH